MSSNAFTPTRLLAALLGLMIASLTTDDLRAETAYISDELTVPLRSGPSSQHRILHRGLPSGTRLEILTNDEAAGFSQIRTTRGTEGWVRTQYLVSQPIAKMRLAGAQRELNRAKDALAQAQAEIRELRTSNANQTSASQKDATQIADLQSELNEIKQISANAVESHNENLTLKESNARLRDELDDMAEERNRLEANAENQAILYGAGFVLLGLIAGVLIKSRPQRSAWS